MPPPNNKRKRPEPGQSYDSGHSRPSPHRPEGVNMAYGRGRGGYPRGGRGGPPRHNRPVDSPSPAAARNGSQPAAVQRIQADVTPTSSTPGYTTPVQRSDTPVYRAAEIVPEERRAPPEPFHYDYLTEEILSEWEEHGRREVVDTAHEMDILSVCSLLQELIRAALDGRLPPGEVASVIRQLDKDGNSTDGESISSLFANAISMLEDSDIKNPALHTLVRASDVDPDFLRMELDIPLLSALDLVRSTFSQMRTRKTTNLLYRQANFNLLREEAEGYAKLMTEYFNSAQEASSPRQTNPYIAEEAFQRTKALVGSFDLDVGRVLDITLDISANLLVKAYGFFMKFYRCSSWWPAVGTFDNVKWMDQGFDSFPTWALPSSGRTAPTDKEKEQLLVLKELRDVAFWRQVSEIGMDAFYQLGSRRIIDYESVAEVLATSLEPELDARGKEVRSDKRKRINEDRRYMRETKSLPPPGNSDAAQLLGFKLRYYASQVREPSDSVPENLIALAALLIKIGFVSLRDLYPHLQPSDDLMEQERARLEKEKADKEARERPGAGANALVNAGALVDDMPQPVRPSRFENGQGGANTPKPDKKDDKNEEGAKEDLPIPDNQKLMLLRALLLVGALPEALYILGRFPWLAEVDTTIPPYLLRIVRQMLSTIAQSACPLSDREGLDSPRDQLADTSTKPGATLNFVPRLPKKPVRWLGLETLDEKEGQEYRFYYGDWADNIPICRTTEDVFLLCNTFLGFLGPKIGSDPEVLGPLLRLARDSLDADSSEDNKARWYELMKRLLVPALSFTKHNPSLTQAVFDLLLKYPISERFNIYAEWFLGKTSRLPDMRVALAYNKAEAKDILRRVTNDTGKKYARSLAKISYSSPGVVMLYMISQLESYSNMIPALVECARFFPAMAYDVLTWCLLTSLNGQGRNRMQADGMLTSPWLQALSSYVASLFARYHSILDPSPILQYLASELNEGNSTDLEMFEQLSNEMAGIKAEQQFNDAQVQAMAGGDNLQSIILQQLSDQRHLRKSPAKRFIKSLSESNLVGQLLVAVAQERQMYQDRDAASNMPLKVLTNNVDKVHQVLLQYLDVLRTNLSHEDFVSAVPDVISLIRDFGIERGIAFTICRSAIMRGVAQYDEMKRQEGLEEKRRRQSNEKEIADSDMDVQTTDGQVNANDISPWHPSLHPVISELESVVPDLGDRVGIPFYVTFWTLSQSDVVVFTESYTSEIDKLSKQMSQYSPERNDSSTALREKERKKKALQEVCDSLRHEVKTRVALYSKVSTRLSHREKAHWFPKVSGRKDLDARHIHLLQDCFLPRAILSPMDAHYSYLMLRLLHDKGTPGFSTANLLSQIFRKHELATFLFQCTALEAQCYGRFLNEILRMILLWHGDKSVYEKEAIGTKTKLVGFAKPFDTDTGPEVFVDYESFRRLVSNWHTALSGALQICFESGEYSHIRSGIIVLKAVCQHFPALSYMGRNMLSHVTRLSKEETRHDLKLMAMSLIGPLKQREKNWVDAAHFRLGDPAGKANRKSASNAEGAATEQVKSCTTTTDGLPKTNVSDQLPSGAGVEDGEVEEEKANSSRNDSRNEDLVQKSENVGRNMARDNAQTMLSTASTAPKTNGASHSRPQQEEVRARGGQGPPGPAARPGRHDARAVDVPKTQPSTTGRLNEREPFRRDDGYGRLDRPGHFDSRSREHSPNRARVPAPPSASRPGLNRDERGSQYGRDDRYGDSRNRPPVFGSGQPGASQLPAASPRGDRPGFINSVVSVPASSESSHAPRGPEPPMHDNSRPARNARNGEERRDRRHDTRPDLMPQSQNDAGRQLSSRLDTPPDHTPTGPRRNFNNNRLDGRDNAPVAPNAEATYGRLNSGHDAPSGPRGPSSGTVGRGGRSFTIPIETSNLANASPRSVDSPSFRGAAAASPLPGRNSPSTFDRRNGPNTSAVSSTAEPVALPGVHPSRLAQLNANTPNEPSANAQSSVSSPNHATRGPLPTHSQTPSGPRSTGRGNMTPGSATAPGSSGLPTGSSADNNGPRRMERSTDSRGNITALNSVAPNVQAGNAAPGKDVSFRGASSRQASFTANDGAIQSIASPMEPPARRGDGANSEHALGRQPSRTDMRSDTLPKPGDREGPPRFGRREEDHQRDGRNASRDPSDGPGRRLGPNVNVDDRGDPRFGRDSRDRHPSERNTRADDGDSRRGPPPNIGNFGPQRGDWERAGPMDNGRRMERQGGRGGGDFRFAGPPRQPENPMDEGSPADGRKRRHDDGPFDASKRRRSAR